MTIGQARLPTLSLRKTSLVPAPSPLSRLRDFHSIDSAQEDLLDKLVLARRRHRCLFGVPKGFEPTAADASEQAPGKTVVIAAGASTSTGFSKGQSGTGRLSCRLRRLQRNANPPALQGVEAPTEAVVTLTPTKFTSNSKENRTTQLTSSSS